MSSIKAYPGSCHCGEIQYQVKLKFPPIHDFAVDSVRIYKCNSPTNIEELGEYRCNKKKHAWYFCKKCGVRVLGVNATWEQIDLDVENWAGTKGEGEPEKLQKVWKTKGESRTFTLGGKTLTGPYYLSVNAVTLEPSEDIDLVKWHDNGWLFYVENFHDTDDIQVGKPYYAGMY